MYKMKSISISAVSFLIILIKEIKARHTFNHTNIFNLIRLACLACNLNVLMYMIRIIHFVLFILFASFCTIPYLLMRRVLNFAHVKPPYSFHNCYRESNVSDTLKNLVPSRSPFSRLNSTYCYFALHFRRPCLTFL